MTRQELWSRNAALRPAERSTSGGPSLGRSPGAQKGSVAPSIKIKSRIRENRDDTIFGAGPRKSCSFFISIMFYFHHAEECVAVFLATNANAFARRSLALEKVRSDVRLLPDRIEV